MKMENEARGRHKDLLQELGVGDEETRQAREPTEFEIEGERIDSVDHRGVAGNVTEFDGNLGLVIGAGGGSLTLFDAVRRHGGMPANYCEIGGNPSVSKAKNLTKLVLQKPGVDKIAVMMSIVSNTRVDIVARGVIKACLELGFDPSEKIAIFRIPGAWEEEGFKILERYGVDYADRSVSLNEAARRAVEKGNELIVLGTEGIPRRDVAGMVELATLRGARIIGPNCLGIIVPDVIKMGGIGGPARNAAQAYTPGPIGVISRSGGMTTEMSSTLSAAGLGQSTAVSIGGDAIIGSTYAELMPLFEADERTQGIVIYTEPGGRMEAELARWVTANDSRVPIVAFMAGRFMDDMPGMSFGHAGTIVEGREDTAGEKIARLADAGIAVAERIEDIPGMIGSKIAERSAAAGATHAAAHAASGGQ